MYNGSALAASVAGTTATVSGLTAGTAYTFTVRAKDAADNVSAASNPVTVTTDTKSTVQPWATYVAYKVNDLVSFGGKTYKALQANTSLPGWEPPHAPAIALPEIGGDPVNLLWMIPITEEERKYAEEQGTERLFARASATEEWIFDGKVKFSI
ncbi:suppressor of fused domain protein [Paenibacillus sp. MZ04-78.2]|uniref:carbohydrate-binding protein n=1 Tax=Paenibacillus sp. MZ04-78.2 TaxID=2962034 RepID=UPI0020B661E3|nr:carbohydrate-binding protein [Paenibacillus sp. MZ04-78.2]MCP3774470.1 suppressor of fused domain protein [Paenibacillus sp. MZ04-78.2]